MRTGPAKFDVGSTTVNHWFDGMAMLHRFSFADGRVTYANRFLRSDSYCEAVVKGSLARGEFATDPCRTLFQRVAAVFSPHLTDNCNVNVDMFGGVPVALTETTLPVRFDAETLQTLGHYAASAEVGGMVSIAHPAPRRRARLPLQLRRRVRPQVALPAVRHSRRWLARACRRRDAGRQAGLHALVRDDRALPGADRVPARRRSVAADAGGRAIHPQLPLAARSGSALSRVRQGQRRASSLRARPTRRSPSTTSTPSRKASDLLIDVITYDDAGIIDQLYLSHLRAGESVNATGRLTRYILSLDDVEPVEVVQLADEMIELPRIDYERCAGRAYRFVWGTGRTQGGDFLDSIVRIDLASRATRTWHAERLLSR